MGELFRRFWLPIMPAEQLPAADCPPMRTRILGEDLVAFRDTNGQVGVLEAFCPHRRAPLFFGRNEECGLRCVYHGWKFDVDGTCVDMPNEPAESNFKHKVQTQAYPGVQRGGIIWIYMGAADKQPELPDYYWCTQPNAEDRVAVKMERDCNYAQAIEGTIDSSHLPFLHRDFATAPYGSSQIADAPGMFAVRETDFGFVYGARRPAGEGKFYWRVSAFVLPAFTHVAAASRAGNGIFVVPIDDEHTWWWYAGVDETVKIPVPPGRLRDAVMNRDNVDMFVRALCNAVDDPTVGLIPGTWRKVRNLQNDFLIDRQMQRTVNYTGIPGANTQDVAVTDSMGPIYDRTNERLGTTDVAIIHMRRQLIRMARDVQRGIEPPQPANHRVFAALPMAVLTAERNFDPLWDEHYAGLKQELALSAG
jgi:phenylpropionate dioxygenase-like ring-hydroxylating dioxygenase large terminal subunit